MARLAGLVKATIEQMARASQSRVFSDEENITSSVFMKRAEEKKTIFSWNDSVT